ncbi:MAG: hypothetical protein P8Q36_04495 [Alphaproteobacteria bacterium]|jgi:hypothetical protein|nr:hypothetical protein [Rhodospirillaceae bacterium]MDG2480115.1 hypothetical protein [Alphaproteobacteria bacterium]MBT6203588.1 hypothetical protein [Rhodospirillaceae bacterium]MBT6510452.1 hypothetical protein [Rhodospirillaceae bacterium]MBT7612448.1 hypothetical protein [Rhodospirillaceae bacterium]
MQRLEAVGGYLSILENTRLADMALESLALVIGDLSVWDNPALRDMAGLDRLGRVDGISVVGNAVLERMPVCSQLASARRTYIENNDNLKEVQFVLLRRPPPASPSFSTITSRRHRCLRFNAWTTSTSLIILRWSRSLCLA